MYVLCMALGEEVVGTVYSQCQHWLGLQVLCTMKEVGYIHRRTILRQFCRSKITILSSLVSGRGLGARIPRLLSRSVLFSVGNLLIATRDFKMVGKVVGNVPKLCIPTLFMVQLVCCCSHILVCALRWQVGYLLFKWILIFYSLFLSWSVSLPYPSGVPAPASTRLSMDEVYDENGKPQPEVVKAHFIREGRLQESVALRIINECEC